MSKEVHRAQYSHNQAQTLRSINFGQCYHQQAITIIIIFNSYVNICSHLIFCNRRWYVLHDLIFNSNSLNSTVSTVLICFVALYIAVQFFSLSDKTQHQLSQYWGDCKQLLFEDFFCYHSRSVFQSVLGIYEPFQKSFIFLFSRNISLNSSSTTVDRHDKSQFYHTAPRSWWLEVEVRFMNCDCNLSHVIRQLELKQILQK